MHTRINAALRDDLEPQMAFKMEYMMKNKMFKIFMFSSLFFRT